MAEVTIDLCVQKHYDADKRLITLEDYIKETRMDITKLEDSYSTNLERIYDKIEVLSNRPPVWASAIITILSAICAGLAVAAVK